jgi:hypothetical protein
MSKFYAVLIVIFFVFYFADRAKRRKARNIRDNMSARRVRRDSRVRTAAWSVVGLAFAATVALLVLTQ